MHITYVLSGLLGCNVVISIIKIMCCSMLTFSSN